MKGHSGGVSSAVEIHPAIPTNLTKSSGSVRGHARARADNRSDRAPTPRRLTEAAADVGRRGRCSLSASSWRPCWRSYRPAGLYLDDHVKLWICSLPFFVCGAVLSRLYVARANERPAEEWAQHREGGRRPRRRLGVDRVLPPLRRSFALLGHRVGGRDHRRTRRRARSRAADLHSTPPAGQVAPPDRDRRHRRPCGAPVAHVPAPSRPRLRGARLRRPGRHRRARWRQAARHDRRHRTRPRTSYGANGVVVSPSLPDQRDQRARAKAHRPRLPRRALVQPARHRHERGCARNSSTGTRCSTSSRSSATDGARWQSGRST